jgi:hypothetical protein
VVLLNQGAEAKALNLQLGEKQTNISIDAQAIQTVIIQP